MKILDSESYCAICKDPLKMNNIGAVIINKTAQNVCQDPCAIEYNNEPQPLKSKQRNKSKIKPGGNNFNVATGANELQPAWVPIPQVLVETVNHRHSITIIRDEMIIESSDLITSNDFELFYENLLAEQNITKFAIQKIGIANSSNSPISVTLKKNTGDRTTGVLMQFYCTPQNILGQELIIPLIIVDNDLVIGVDSPDDLNDLPFVFKCEITAQIRAPGPNITTLV